MDAPAEVEHAYRCQVHAMVAGDALEELLLRPAGQL
jgi:hypothetical protein